MKSPVVRRLDLRVGTCFYGLDEQRWAALQTLLSVAQLSLLGIVWLPVLVALFVQKSCVEHFPSPRPQIAMPLLVLLDTEPLPRPAVQLVP